MTRGFRHLPQVSKIQQRIDPRKPQPDCDAIGLVEKLFCIERFALDRVIFLSILNATTLPESIIIHRLLYHVNGELYDWIFQHVILVPFGHSTRFGQIADEGKLFRLNQTKTHLNLLDLSLSRCNIVERGTNSFAVVSPLRIAGSEGGNLEKRA